MLEMESPNVKKKKWKTKCRKRHSSLHYKISYINTSKIDIFP